MSDTFKCTPELLCEFFDSLPRDSSVRNFFQQWNDFKSSKSPKKEWEIVAFAGNIGLGHRIYELCDDGQYRWGADLDKIPRSAKKLVNLGCTIHSVRRLSDQQVFKAGDKVDTPSNGRHTIDGFEIEGKDMLVKIGGGYLGFSAIKKLPQPILTTVDGVEMRENEECWIVDKHYKLLPEPEKINEFKRNYYSNCFIFSTYEAAEKYILDHAPKLSLNDVKKICEHSDQAKALAELTTLVKQKLNQ